MKPQNILFIGTGYVGLVSGTCFAEFGFNVTCVDQNKEKIENLNKGMIPLYEPELEALVHKNTQLGLLHFSGNLQEAFAKSDIIFIAVGTPANDATGEADLTYIDGVVKELAPLLNQYKLVVVKSTVPVGTTRRIAQNIKALNPNAKFDIASNPEFLREGSAVWDFLNPDRIIVGVETEKAKNLMEQLYAPLSSKDVSLFFTDLESSELIKYTANAFLATKIAFINEIANLCEETGANIESIAKGIGLDKRIGEGYLQPGPGFGGSCFPKDTKALAHVAKKTNAPLQIVNAVIKANEDRRHHMVEKIVKACDGTVHGKTLAVLGLAFKAKTDDVRESSAIQIVQELKKQGANIRACDPAAIHSAAQLLKDVYYTIDLYDALEGSQAAIILTEWDEFKNLDFKRVKQLFSNNVNPLIIDLRNLYDTKTMENMGINYISIGRREVVLDPFPSFVMTEATSS